MNKIVLIVLLITIIFVSGCVQVSNPAGATPLTGWLFKVDTNLYFVQDYTNESTQSSYLKVLTESEVKQLTNLTELLPLLGPNSNKEEVKEIAIQEVKSAENIDVLANDPITRYGDNKKPRDWIVPLYYENGTCFGLLGVGDESKEFEWGTKGSDVCDTLITEEDAKVALIQYMEENNIQGSIGDGFFIQYLITFANNPPFSAGYPEGSTASYPNYTK